ncbi:MAG: peptidoglycan-binding protein [Christensenellaceae bacterium]|jgi:peptidoglycan hydrolase-like protein with peptidoglycan-binding domain|nr:peptidoglycan-binding protein [Christensenellaceae bacterium]
MANGTLKILTTMGQGAEPVASVAYAIKDKAGNVLFQGVTNENGESEVYTLSAPSRELTMAPAPGTHPYGLYDVWIAKPGFTTITYIDVEIFDGIESVLNVNMEPLPAGEDGEQTIVIPPPTADEPTGPQLQEGPPDQPASRILPRVAIPDYITVHLGTPGNASAPNVRVRFADYIKNVASSEIYPTWPNNALIANIHAIVTFALNRIYTEWYRSRGFNFDITNSTATDQAFVNNREIFANISQIVDGIFNVYARRTGFANPYFTEYCNGTTVTCKGLSQWGTVTLANRGFTPLQILRNYYPNDLELATAPGGGIIESFPGTSLTLGSTGDSVRRMQNQLNRIRVNYPAIPVIANPNGVFGADTANAVRVFQRTFNLVQDGIVGRSTWNKISQVFGAVTGLSELGGEGERIGLSPTPPTTTIRQGARGADVIHAQFLLNYISQFYPEVPSVIQDGSFGASTTSAVQAFQRRFGLTADGIVGPNTWRRLYEVARAIIDQQPPTIPVPPITPPVTPPAPPPAPHLPYPGTPLREGSRGDNVRTLQTMLNNARVTYNAIPLLAPDGIFGPATLNAVRTFQLYRGLTVDGVVGPLTWNALASLM